MGCRLKEAHDGFAVTDRRGPPPDLRQRLDHDELSYADIREALASLGTTLVEDLVSESTQTYYKTLEPGEGLHPDGD
jgi:hypothetical protein